MPIISGEQTFALLGQLFTDTDPADFHFRFCDRFGGFTSVAFSSSSVVDISAPMRELIKPVQNLAISLEILDNKRTVENELTSLQ